MIGQTLGPYQVVAKLGEGGMGEVYRARDTKLDRDVALKILPESFASDPDRLMRFEREAKTLASLNHPNIAAVYGLEASGDTQAIVLELVEGPTLEEALASRIANRGSQIRGPRSEMDDVEWALPIALQIASALEVAHEAGIVHRDLKPTNIKVKADGTVKVLDFGLAKMVAGPEGPALQTDGGPDLQVRANSPTMTSPALTQMGLILGTAAYMSPEQAKGHPVDRRADIWAFGVVLYEMLTGRQMFDPSTGSGSPRATSRGEAVSVSEVLAAVLRADIDLTGLPAATPPAVRRVLARCLQRDPRQRLRDIGDARLELMDAGEGATPAAGGAPGTSRNRLALLLTGTALAAAGFGWLLKPAGGQPVPVTRFEYVLPADQQFTGEMALSADGATLAYLASGRIYVRPLDAFEARPVSMVGVTGRRACAGGGFAVSSVTFSPDGQWLGYLERTRVPADSFVLRRVRVSGGTPETLAAGPGWPGLQLQWVSGQLIFGIDDRIHAVDADGGGVRTLLELPPEAQSSVVSIGVSDDGHDLLFVRWSPARSEIYLQALTGGAAQLVHQTPASILRVASVPAGYLVWLQADDANDGIGAIWAARFEAGSASLGDPVRVVENVEMRRFVLSADGTLAYLPGTSQVSDLAWIEPGGRETPAGLPPADYGRPRVAPDGELIALEQWRRDENDILLWNPETNALQRVASGPGVAVPRWSLDGSSLYFLARRALHRVSAPWTAPSEPVVELPGAYRLKGVSADGHVLYAAGVNEGSRLMARSLEEGAEPWRVEPDESDQEHAAFSPDGRWVAYFSAEGPDIDLFVRPFPETAGARWQLARGPFRGPIIWSRSGRELYFLQDDRLMRMSVAEAPGGAAIQWSPPTELPGFAPAVVRDAMGSDSQWDLMPDGRVLSVPSEAWIDRILIVRGWLSELQARVDDTR